MSIEAPLRVHISRITLRGLGRADAQRMVAALQQELYRLATTQAQPTQAFEVERASLPALQRSAGERPETTGRRVAERIAAQWTAPPSHPSGNRR